MDWIMFFRGGETYIDVVLCYGCDEGYRSQRYAVTPHFGKVSADLIIETRSKPSPGTTIDAAMQGEEPRP